MSATTTDTSLEAVERQLREQLARGDVMLSTATPILRHLLVNEDQALFSDEIVARVRGMLTDVARQILHAQAEAARVAERQAYLSEREDRLAQALFDESSLLGYVHALAVEGKVALQLQARCNVDPVLSPLLQELVAATDEVLAASAMAVLAAQARFVQHHRRMALPIGELPGDLFHKTLLVMRSEAGGHEEAAAGAERTLRGRFDESHGRIGLISRLIMRMGKAAPRALAVDHAGTAIFATALAMAAGQERDVTVLSFSDRQFARLALAMRAAGLKQPAVEEQLLFLHPDVTLPAGFDGLSAERAARLLSSSLPLGA
jgi:hypothetical protein